MPTVGADTEVATVALEALRTDSPARTQVIAAFPEVVALAAPAPTPVEHDPGDGRPLLDHIATRLLGRKLRGLELAQRSRFQAREGVTQAAFDRLAAKCRRVLDAGLGPALRVAILHLDIAKTSDAQLRAAWTALGIPLDVHNEASTAILRRQHRTPSWPLPDPIARLALAWIESHGLAGQHVRGEGPLAMFAPLVTTLRQLAPASSLRCHCTNRLSGAVAATLKLAAWPAPAVASAGWRVMTGAATGTGIATVTAATPKGWGQPS